MKLLESLDKAISALKGKDGLSLLIGDWDHGVKLLESMSGSEIAAEIERARGKYGDRFTWRAFNEKLEISWDGESGTVCDDMPIDKNRKSVLLETDYHQFPGVKVFWPEDFSAPHYTRADVEEIHQADRIVHFRLLRLRREEKGHGCHPST